MSKGKLTGRIRFIEKFRLFEKPKLVLRVEIADHGYVPEWGYDAPYKRWEDATFEHLNELPKDSIIKALDDLRARKAAK